MTDAPRIRAGGKRTVALISEVFWEPDVTRNASYYVGLLLHRS